MPKEMINTTNKFILPPSGDAWSEEARRQLIEDLQKITPEQARAVGEELEKKQEASQSIEWDSTDQIDETKDIANANFEEIWTIAWKPVNFDSSNRIVKFDWETFDLNTFQGIMAFMDKVSQYDDLFCDAVAKIMFTLNI